MLLGVIDALNVYDKNCPYQKAKQERGEDRAAQRTHVPERSVLGATRTHGTPMTYEELLEGAPNHYSPEFIVYLRMYNEVVYEDTYWLGIRNFKYGWVTVFTKDERSFMDIDGLVKEYGMYEWRVKPPHKRTVKRFHIHIMTPVDDRL